MILIRHCKHLLVAVYKVSVVYTIITIIAIITSITIYYALLLVSLLS